ncbi:ankyrin [Hypoxylon sp. FL1857]|nr:ankyrin [Hypoxylon sp. FL1857]
MPAFEDHRPVIDVWEVYRKVIYRQYIIENKKLKDVVHYMKEHYQFCKNQRDYECRLKRWGYSKNISEAEWNMIEKETQERTKQGKASEVLRAGLRLSGERVRARTQLPTLAGKYSLNTSNTADEMGAISVSSRMPYLRVQTPPLVAQNEAWPDSLPWLSFYRKFEPLITALFRESISLPSRVDDFRPTQNPLMRAGSNSQEIALHRGLEFYLDLLCPEIHEGDHMITADILLSGERDSASIELIKLAIYFLSNNMGYEFERLTNGEVRSCVDALDKFGLLTEENIDWLNNASEETSEVLIQGILQHSLWEDDGNLLRWILKGCSDVNCLVSIEAEYTVICSDGSISDGSSTAQTLLQAATYYGSISCCKILLDAGADPNRRANGDGHFPLEYAADHLLDMRSSDEIMEIFDLLLSKGAKLALARQAFSLAVYHNNTSLVRMLMEGGATVSPATFKVAARNPEVLSLLLNSQHKWTCQASSCPNISDMISPSTLRKAIKCVVYGSGEKGGSLRAVEVLLHAGADPDGIHERETHIEYISGRSEEYTRSFIPLLTLLLDHGGHVEREEGCDREYTSALQLAAGRGLIPVVQELLKAGANVNFHRLPPSVSLGYEGPTALFEALKKSHAEAAKLILESKPRMLGPELREAARVGDLELMDMLFDAGAPLEDNMLPYALECKSPDIMDWFLRKGVAVPQTSLLEVALCTRNFRGISKVLSDAEYDSICLFEATSLALRMEQYVPVVETLVKKRAIVVRDGLETAALAIAVMNRNAQLCRLLSDTKFEPGSWIATYRCVERNQPGFLHVEQNDGIFEVQPWTARSAELTSIRVYTDEMHILDLAARFESRFAVNYAVEHLIDLGAFEGGLIELKSIFANRNLRESALIQIVQACGVSPLVVAVRFYPGLVNVLLEAGADANARPSLVSPLDDYDSSRTPLQAAVERNNIDIINQLLKAGADVNAPPGCTQGATCLQIAAIGGYIGVAGMLLANSAEVNGMRARVRGRTAIEGAAENGRLDMFATQEGHFVIARMLRDHIGWGEHDHTIYHLWGIVDEMTQELSPDELRMIGIQCTTDEPEYIGDDIDDDTGNDLDETELYGDQADNQDVPIATPMAAESGFYLGYIPAEGYNICEPTTEQRLLDEELSNIEGFNQQNPCYVPPLGMGDFSADVSEFMLRDAYMGCDDNDAMDWEADRRS